MKKTICVLTALATLVFTAAPLAAADYKNGPTGSRKSSTIRINSPSGSGKESSSTRKKSSGTRKTSGKSGKSSSRSREPKNVRGKSDPVHVEGHYTKNGTFVPPHVRGAPDGDRSNNEKPYADLNRPRKSNK
ncbi:MAG TPA: hypothetical protein VGJ16_01645 [Pirellulales bacterium]|jgi:hypothetical protein